MKKTVIGVLSLVLAIMLFATVFASCDNGNGTEGLVFRLNDKSNTYYVSGSDKLTSTDIVIPAVYKGKSVTHISIKAFFECTDLTSITIPSSVTSIGNSAFSGCTGLTSITIPSSVTSIGMGAFSKCTGLTSVIFEDNSQLERIGMSAFCECTGLSNVTIPSSVTIIENYAFEYCTGLASIMIPSSVTSITKAAFRHCTGLTSINVEQGNAVYNSAGNCIIETAKKALVVGCKSSVIPTDGSVTSIGNSAFIYCEGLTSVTIPNSVTSIGNSAFFGCKGLSSIIFTGTKAEWNAISKGNTWASNTGSYTVHCTDGDIANPVN